MSTLIDLLSYGQSCWLDNLTRKMIVNGELKKRVTEQGLRGITSNPSIFNKAITGSDDYDNQIKELVMAGKTPLEIYDALTIKDVQDACDLLRPVYEQSGGADGFVSLEVSPYLARDTQGSCNEARRLFKAVDRPNCFIKIPGTKEGVPAIEEMLYEGININITLLFSIDSYVEVANAYIRAIGRRINENKPVDKVISVASFFLSRIDVLTDQLLGHYIISSGETQNKQGPVALLGKAGVASAKLAYQEYKKIFSGSEWGKLAAKGAHVQRPLWASTSNKDPLGYDLRYVETLIGWDTVNTLPDETIMALADHGKLQENAIEEGLDDAAKIFGQLKQYNIDINAVTWQLEYDGIQKFIDAYNKLMAGIGEKRMKTLGELNAQQDIKMGNLKKEMDATFTSLDEKQVGRRLFNKDPYLWKSEPEQVKTILNGLGWLTLPQDFTKKADELIAFTNTLKEDGFKYAVLLGMGGSSLCSEIARETFGKKDGYLELLVLDNTSPEAILDLENKIDIKQSLFITATKSGGTKETLSFFKYFYDRLEKAGKKDPGNNFVAITDAGSPLVKTAEEYRYRKIFINPADVGGRYSVLSDFGLLPMALMGVDIKGLLSSTMQMEASCNPNVPATGNPGISLGAALGICQRNGKDKVTFVLSSSISSFGYWVEQLLAESTGKEGKGLIPVNGEALETPENYGNDRVFIYMYLPGDDNNANELKLAALETAGHPVVNIKVPDKLALGGEYYRWEIATAIAGMIIGINPFDQPNVAESKKNTDDLLKEWKEKGAFKKADPILQTDGLSFFTGNQSPNFNGNHSVKKLITAFTKQAQRGDYIALLPYFMMTEARTKILQSWREEMGTGLKVATTMLNGPRYLHSTGQLHKGGPGTGLYILLVSEEQNDLSIPGEQYGFAILHEAQSLGDFRSLCDKGRRVLLISLGKDIDKGLQQLQDSIAKTLQNA
jgi:transaldolase / glucose-6-phosphate isomerase